ncbi:MAG: ABC transporter permease [Acidobacteriota bacterium]|jgi:lipopolysaccharide transport system permease protein
MTSRTSRLRHHLFLLRELVKRDFQGRYAGSLLSFFWSFVQPLWLLVLFTFVFSTVMKLKLAEYGVPTENFGIFLFCGLLPWMAVQEGVQRASTAITDNSALVKKLQFPSEILILSVVLGALLHEAIAAGVFVLVLALLGEIAWTGLPWLAVAVPLQVALTLGLGLLLASAQVFFRDTAQVVAMVLNGWFYLTPIVYPLPLVPDWIRPWIELNPLTPIVELYRSAFLGAPFPLVGEAVGTAAVAALLALAGAWLFRKLRPAFVDEI